MAAKPKTTIETSSVAYSYIRFSTPEQRKGDSLRRQTDDAKSWCDRNGIRLDTSRTLHDLGKSAYLGSHRKNPDRNALAAFLKLVEERKVARGSYLLVESLDRLTREHIRPALTLLLNLIEAGVRIVQLKPVEVIYDEDVEPMQLMMALMELSRGNSESKVKSQRVGAAWAKKRSCVREKRELLTGQLPGWLELREGKLYAIPAKAAAVQRIFTLAGQGFGAPRIVKQLVAENVPPLLEVVKTHSKGERPGRWLRYYVSLLLNDRRVVGELQMRCLDGSNAGDPVVDYYPQVVTEAEWQRARAGVNARRVQGKKGHGSYEKAHGFINLFVNLLRDARDGGAYNVTLTSAAKRGSVHRILRNLSAQGHAPTISFPYDTFERAILTTLREVDPAELIDGVEEPDERLALAAELERVATQVNQVKDNILAGGDVAALADVLRQLKMKRCELAVREQEAQQKAATPLNEAWRDTKTLLDVLDNAPDPPAARLRLRAALRRIVSEIRVLVVPRGKDRLAAVQIHFSTGAVRNYALLHRPPRSNGKARQEGRWWARSLSTVAKPGDLDLRDPEQARQLEALLATVELESVNE